MLNSKEMLNYINSEIRMFDIDNYDTLTFSQNKIKDFFKRFSVYFNDEDVNGIFDYLKQRIEIEDGNQ